MNILYSGPLEGIMERQEWVAGERLMGLSH